eukprot:TRINITY_DN1523_c0_g1_i1.p1 TRINITY_DN1523_c0_g1~~TRINITY_DN1523_c0_g1_i1.p1  ORF type:complete len:269 (-),score=63.59 TRINITY_DN1523_c0_g1_i1:99-905(-)
MSKSFEITKGIDIFLQIFEYHDFFLEPEEEGYQEIETFIPTLLECIEDFKNDDVNKIGGCGYTALYFAVENEVDILIKKLLTVPGIDVNLKPPSREYAIEQTLDISYELFELFVEMENVIIPPTLYSLAIYQNKIDIIDKVLSIHPEYLDLQTSEDSYICDSYGMNVIAFSTAYNFLELSEYFLKKGYNVNTKIPYYNDDRYDGTALYIACEKGYYKHVELLLNHPDIDPQSFQKAYENICLYCSNKSEDIVKQKIQLLFKQLHGFPK